MQCLDWLSLSLQDPSHWVGEEGLSLNPGPLSLSCNQALPWAGSGHLVPALYSCLISLQCLPSGLWAALSEARVYSSIHSINIYWALLCARWYSGDWGYSSDQTGPNCLHRTHNLPWNQSPWLSSIFCCLCPQSFAQMRKDLQSIYLYSWYLKDSVAS